MEQGTRKVAKILSAGIFGVDAYEVLVEVDVSPGIPSFNIVGLPDSAVKESRDRVKSAIKNSGFNFPQKRITVNLAPADIKKEGSLYDLPIAVGILASTGEIKNPDEKLIFVGELSLEGRLKSVNGIVPILVLTKEKKKSIIIPCENQEAEFIGADGFYAERFEDVIKFLKEQKTLTKIKHRSLESADEDFEITFDDIKGQDFAKRALTISAAGRHNIIMVGPPGAGKTILSKSIVSIMPKLSEEEELEVMKIYSVAGVRRDIGKIPFRSPHYTISDVALIGGGPIPKPGEVTLAHRGILFLDELPEFGRKALESLRTAIEERKVVISRAQRTSIFPASFQLISAMNPCPCGNFRNPKKECRCSPRQIKNYISKISGPLLDRFDVFLEIPPLEPEEIISSEKSSEMNKTKEAREKVLKAREIQLKRYKEYGFSVNSEIPVKHQNEFLKVDDKGEEILKNAIKKYSMSARAVFRTLKVARTIADIDESEKILSKHILEAISLRKAESFFQQDVIQF